MRDTRYRMPQERRSFGGETYSYQEWRKLKRDAESHADRLRDKGYNVRLATFNGGYSIYARR